MNPKISIIVPVYNTEKYLHKSINSLLNQTLKDIEIILVNDGSTDGSKDICKEFEKKDSRVKLIDKENGGQGSARNKGLEVVKGEYIAFIDSDDYIEPQMYEKMYDSIKKYNCDVVACQVNMVDEEGNVLNSRINKNEYGNIENGEEAIKRYLKYGRWSVWDKLYKREVIKEVKFLENRTCAEDHAVIIPILKNTNKMVTIDDYLYNYLVREGSTTNSKFSIKNFDSVYVWEYVLEQSKFMNKDILEMVSIKVHCNYIDLINSVIKNNRYDYVKEISYIINSINKSYTDVYKSKYLSRKYKLGSQLIIRNFKLYKNLYKIVIKFKDILQT